MYRELNEVVNELCEVENTLNLVKSQIQETLDGELVINWELRENMIKVKDAESTLDRTIDKLIDLADKVSNG